MDNDSSTTLDNTAKNSPFMFAAAAFLSVLVITALTVARNVKIKRIQYGKQALVLYFIAVFYVAICRSCDFCISSFVTIEGYTLGLIGTSPLLFVYTSSAEFLEYMISSFYTSFPFKMKFIYLNYKKINVIILGAFWLIEFPVFVVFICEAYFKNSSDWFNVFHYIFVGFCVLITVLTVPIVVIYITELKKFRVTYQGKKASLFFVLIVALFQTLVKILNSIFVVTGVWLDLENNSTSFPYYQIGQTIYTIISEVLPLLSYTLYIKKDTAQLMVLEMTVLDGDATFDYCSATLVEEHLLKHVNDGI